MGKNKNAENNQEDLLQQQQENAQKNTMHPNQEGEEQEKGQDTSSQREGEKDVEDIVFFDRYPQAQKYFETADGRKFFNAHDARNHANTLKNKSVNEIKK